MSFLAAVFVLIRAFLTNRLVPAAENLALCQQLAILERTAKRPRLRRRERVFWVWLSKLWTGLAVWSRDRADRHGSTVASASLQAVLAM